MNAHDGPGPSHKAPPVADPLDRTRFPVDPWRLVETRFSAADLGTTESLFTVGNGYLGLRGNYSESRDAHLDGTFINGFHETWPISHAEEAYGFARIGQTIVNVPDPKVIRLYVDDEPLQISVADLIEYERALDFRTGVLTRELIWRTPGGKRVKVRSTRMVPLGQRHLAVLSFEVTLLDERASLVISSQLINRQDADVEVPLGTSGGGAASDPRRAEAFKGRVLVPRLHGADPATGRIKLGYRTAESGMTLGVVADHTLETVAHTSMSVHSEDDMAKVIYRVAAEPGVAVKLTKVVSFHTAATVPPRELIDRCERTLDRTHEEGIAHQYAAQEAWLADFWQRADVEVPGHPAIQQAIRWNLFSILQASARAEGQGIAAKGVSGSGYGGHYFWDTEIYVMPFLTYTIPWAARNALRFRHALLDNARARARELSQKGALFPWRTINGQEASAYYAAGTAQYHIDADVAYALSQYVGATGDEEFLSHAAVDIFVETARLWADLGFWRDESRRTFHIHGVTGPDEYTTVVNDNLYTNVLARFNLRRAARAVWELERDDPDAYAALVRRTGLTAEEPDEWAECAQGMSIPFDEFLGIHPQDAHFLEREMWDLENTPLEKRPLLLNYHPLVIYRFQVLKQADVVLALYLQGEEFTAEQKKADFDYYDPITTGDSTLSAVMQSIVAAEVGYHELALRYFVSALFVDLDDRHNNTADGVHVASTGGVWSALVSGFGGFRDTGSAAGEEQWQIDPRLPEGWSSLVYRVTLRGTRVRVTVRPEELELFVEDGAGPLTFCVRDEPVTVDAGSPVTLPLKHQGPRLDGEPPYPAGIQRADGTVISAIVPTGD
ncbi:MULTISPECIES: glycoside hydrolase family 65 protein [unclassified Nocardioides]|uniref:glycoside hydrolase family 65 protein n=1 Tax=unclassified Nocardioides TaxID=2615069 RepID=UPI0006F4E179|nr:MULTISPECIES: glycosyl hydrolase family 65 protein [unclassified Nocardioides]KRA39221.1 kojibiose phosphorylase [Nocardioides sp. Root614]KRA93180.1 kojibiose phosphorylase [Nocardioides sp. Root682]